MKLSRLSVRYLRKQKSRTLLTLLCVVVALYLLSVLGMMASSFLASMEKFVRKTAGNNDVWAYETSGHPDMPDQLLAAFAECGPEGAKAVEEIRADTHRQFEEQWFQIGTLDKLRASDAFCNLRTVCHGEIFGGFWSNGGAHPMIVFSTGDAVKPFFNDSTNIWWGDESSFATLNTYNRPMLAEGQFPQAADELVVPLDWKSGAWNGNFSMEHASTPFMDPVAIGDTITFTLQPAIYQLDESSPTVRMTFDLDIASEEDTTPTDELDEEDVERAERKAREKAAFRSRNFINQYGTDQWVDAEHNDGNWLTLALLEPTTCTFRVVGYSQNGSIVCHPSDQQLRRFEGTEQLGFDTVDDRMVIPSNEFLQLLLQTGLTEEQIAVGLENNALCPNTELLSIQFREDKSLATIAFAGAFLALLVLFVVAIARLVIDNAFEISAQERVQQYAVLRTIGASKWQIMRMILQEAVWYLIAGIPIAMGAAYGTMQALAAVLRAEKLEFSFDYFVGINAEVFSLSELITVRIFPSWALIIVIVGIWSVGISAYTSAQKAASIPPMAAMAYGRPTDLNEKKRAKARRQKKEKRAKKRSGIVQRVFGFPFYYAARNLKRNPRRYRLTILSTMLALTTFTLAITGLRIYWNVRTIEKRESTDFTLSINSEMYAESDNNDLYMVRDTMKAMEATGYFEYLHVSSAIGVRPDAAFVDAAAAMRPYLEICPVSESEFNAYVAEEAGMTYAAFRDAGGLLLPEYIYQVDSFTGEKIREMLVMWQKDKLPSSVTYQMYEKRNRRTGETETVFHTIPILGSFDGRAYLTACSGAQPQYVALVALDCFDDLRFGKGTDLSRYVYQIEPYDSRNAPSVHSFHATIHADAAKNQLTAAREWLEAYEMPSVNKQVNDFSADMELADRFTRVIIDIVVALVLVLFFICVANIVNTMHTAILNRRREYAMLRAVGLKPSQLRATVFMEAGFYTLLSALLGIALSAGLLLLFLSSTKLTMDGWWLDLLPIGLISAGIAVLIALGAAWSPLRRLEKDAIADTIREIE